MRGWQIHWHGYLACVRCLSCLLFTVLVSAAVAPVPTFIYPAPESAQDVRFNDLIEILNVALEHTKTAYGPYRVMASSSVMNEARQLRTLETGAGLTVVWSSTSEEKERDLLPIRIPLRKGLLGYRIALIAKDAQATIDKAQTVDELRQLVIGQGIGWGDVALYNQNGFTVATANYDQLFRMVAARRFDLFPRGIGEVFKEYDGHVNLDSNLTVEQHLLIEYPWPYYFFFNKKDKALADRVEAGLRAMIKDGSFDAIFKKYNGADIARAKLSERRIIHIKNPFLPKATPLEDKSLWFDPIKEF